MKTPVLIAAHNEGRLIGRALDRLDASVVEPFVIANGCTDDTVAVAESFGANVNTINLPDQGKLPAIQHVLRNLGDRALGPVLYIDADSYPVKTSAWEQAMVGAVTGAGVAQAASGPLGYFDGFRPSDAFRTAKRRVDIRRKHANDEVLFRGNNMATRFDTKTLDAVLDLPHIWPGEDLAIEFTIKRLGGRSTQVLDYAATVMTSSRSMLNLTRIAMIGGDAAHQETLQQYWDRAAEGSIRYRDYLDILNQTSNQEPSQS